MAWKRFRRRSLRAAQCTAALRKAAGPAGRDPGRKDGVDDRPRILPPPEKNEFVELLSYYKAFPQDCKYRRELYACLF